MTHKEKDLHVKLMAETRTIGQIDEMQPY